MSVHYFPRLREARKNRGLTQQKMADALGVTKSAVSGWERGAERPRLDLGLRAAELLETAPDVLFGGDAQGKPAPLQNAALRNARVGLGMSQTAMAMALGVDVSLVRVWEQGVRPTRTEAEAVARLLHSTVAELFATGLAAAPAAAALKPIGNETLRKARLAAGLSQGALARACDVDQCTVGEWERSGVRPHPHNATKLASLLGTTVSALFDGGVQAAAATAPQPPSTEKARSDASAPVQAANSTEDTLRHFAVALRELARFVETAVAAQRKGDA